MTYVGQSKRKLIVRLKEHDRGCRNAEKKSVKKDSRNDNGIPIHYREEKHNINFKGVKILEIEKNLTRRQIAESIFIYKRKSEGKSMNVNMGSFDLNKCWYPILNNEVF